MRVIGGKHKKRVLKEFDGNAIRPTSDRGREALFNVLQFSIFDSVFLDGFAGSGGVGIEAISRGAKTVIFTDSSKESVKLVNDNLKLVKENATVILTDVCNFLQTTNLKFDFIFLDPPYVSEKGVEALNIISKRKLLNSGGYAIYEHSAGKTIEIDGLVIEKTKKYGICQFDFYKENL